MARTYTAKDHTGVKYGNLTGVRFVKIGSSRNRIWLFLCDCGRECVAVAGHVVTGIKTSCGCGRHSLASRLSKLESLYGFTDEEAEEWARKTDGNCDICGRAETVTHNGKPKSLSIDHCHSSRRVRGVLCSRCNIMLGYYEKHAAFPSKIACFDEYLKQAWPWS